MSDLMSQNSFRLGFGKSRHQIVAHSEPRFARAPAISFHLHPSARVHLQENLVREAYLRFITELLDHGKKLGSVGLLKTYPRVGTLAQPEAAKENCHAR